MEYWMASNATVHNGREEAIQEVLEDPGSAVLFVGYPRWLLHFAASCCILFMLVGIPGNLFTIIALFRTKKLRNATAIFIINLSISDLMFCCFNLPLATSTFWHSSWNHGVLLCRLFPLLRYGLVAVSLFTILSITINRYVMIGHPTLYRTTWIVAFGVLIVTWFGNWGRFGLDTAIGSCSILPDKNGRSPKEFLFVVAFLIPCIAIVVCYARIFYIVRKTASKSRTPHIAASTDAIDISHEQRSASPRSQEEDPSASRSNYAAGVLDTNLSPNHLSTNQLNLQVHQESKHSPRANEETRDPKNKKEKYRQENLKEQPKNPPNIFEVYEAGLEIKANDIPYADSDSPETESFSNKIKESVGNTRSKLERMASRASFILESTLWVQRLNSKVSTGSDQFENSRSNSPERSTAKKAMIVRSESRFTNARRMKNLEPPRMSNKDKKLLKMILVIFSSFLVCYLPITITKTFKDAIDWRGWNIAGYILIYLTTCINPVVYVVMSSEYRSAYKNVLFCRNDGRKETRKMFD
ncbi:G-protein coupled receptor moody isoform X2 [Megachile rotundata]|uniref:G-protein coupled receptor moody isoform X2 n=1 Tax=Megachile rotundata TaxID=143995 RepID=UPI003FD03806